MAATKRPAKTTRTEPKPTLLLLVRHGKTPTTGTTLPGRAPGLHLSDAGVAQAEAAATRIGALDRVGAVYASPLERTRETAAPIARAAGLRVRRNKGLLECDFGDWTGRKLKDLNKLPEWSTVQRYPSGFRFPHGESFAEMQQRMVSTLQALAAEHPGETVVAVSHADPIKAAVAHALGTHLDLFQRIVVSPCSISAILVTAGGPIVLAVNSTGDDLRGAGTVVSDDPSPSWEFSRPNRFTAGAIGEPGRPRVLLQVFAEGVEVDVKCEKQQVMALADHLVKLLADLPEPTADDAEPVEPVEALPPTELAWVVGSISIGVDRANEQIVVLLEEVVVDEDEATMTAGPGTLRVHLTRQQVQGFAGQAASLAATSRPDCRLCGQPIDPDGHACPRLN